MPAVIRPAMASDIDAIALIYAYHVNHSTGTFETEAPDCPEMTRRWQEVETRGLPWLVAEENGEIFGYAYAAPYRTRAAYRHTVEDSIYVRADRVGTGLGKLLMPALIAATQACGMHQMVAVIGDSANHASISLHHRFGFCDAGSLQAVGFKLGRWLDTVFMQRNLLNRGVDLKALLPVALPASKVQVRYFPQEVHSWQTKWHWSPAHRAALDCL